MTSDLDDQPADQSAPPRVSNGERRLAGLVLRLTAANVRVQYAVLFGALALPLVVALVALAQERWYPVLDLAMTELRVRDVGTSHTPTIGLPGRIGDLPEQGSHPGPLSFWVVAPVYRLLGQTPYSMEVATVVVHLVFVALILWCCFRIAGRSGLLIGAVATGLLMRGYGQLLLTQPWNPYFPLLAWVLVLVATMAVFMGYTRWIIAVVAAGTFCAQTHIPYLLLCVAIFAVAAGFIVWQAVRSSGDDRRQLSRPLLLSVGIGVLLWLPPIVQELGAGEGNISRLRDHFGSPTEEVVGLRDAASIVLRHLNVWEAFFALRKGPWEGPGLTIEPLMGIGMDFDVARWPGALLLLLWAGAAMVAWRAGPSWLRAVHAIVALGLVLSWISVARIFGTTWFYLTLWMWAVTALMVIGVIGSAAVLIRRRWPARAMRAKPFGALAAVVALGVSMVMFSLDAVHAEHPEESQSKALGAVVDPTYDAIVEGVGAASGTDGHYLLRWSDVHFFGNKGFGLLNELDRKGLDVRADAFWKVPVTDHRVIEPEEATAQIHLATGAYADDWRRVDGAVEVASDDPRTDDDRARYDELHDALVADLRSDGLDDLLPLVERNMFGLSIDPRISYRAQQYATEMMQIGTEVAVFIAPADAEP